MFKIRSLELSYASAVSIPKTPLQPSCSEDYLVPPVNLTSYASYLHSVALVQIRCSLLVVEPWNEWTAANSQKVCARKCEYIVLGNASHWSSEARHTMRAMASGEKKPNEGADERVSC